MEATEATASKSWAMGSSTSRSAGNGPRGNETNEWAWRKCLARWQLSGLSVRATYAAERLHGSSVSIQFVTVKTSGSRRK